MPLDTQGLRQAACETSGNPLLKEIWAAVQQYNGFGAPATMGDAVKGRASATLDQIYEKCATYMTTKIYKDHKDSQPTVTAKRALRYTAFEALMAQTRSEMTSLGGLLLVGPDNFSKIGHYMHGKPSSYWLERLDPKHQVGHDLSTDYSAWQEYGKYSTNPKESLWERFKNDASKSAVWGYGNTLSNAMWHLCVYFESGVLMKAEPDDTVFSTSNLKTVFSGNGWAAWICTMPMADSQNNFVNYIFSDLHTLGEHHHSSFTEGRPVMAAGEWVVDATGKIQIITAKSGHYAPSVDNLYNFVMRFPSVPDDALLRLNTWAKPPEKHKCYLVSDLRANLQSVKSGTHPPLPGSVVIQRIQTCASGCKPFLTNPQNLPPE